MKKILVLLFTVLFSHLAFSQSNMKTEICIWTPDNFCNYPENINLCSHIHWHNTKMTYIKCQKLDKKNLTAVRITFTSSKDTSINLINHFENIELHKKNSDQVLHPKAFLINITRYDSETNTTISINAYMKDKFKTIMYTQYYMKDETYDVIILFENAESGDIIKIENFLEESIG